MITMLDDCNIFVLKKNVVKYLDKSGELAKIEELATSYKESVQDQVTQTNCVLPLKLTVSLDYVLLAEIAGDFAALLVNEPHLAKQILSDVVRTCCTVLAELDEPSIYLLVRLISFPDLSKCSGETDYYQNTGLFTKYGILFQLYSVEKYTQTVFYNCVYQSCYSPPKLFEETGNCPSCGKKLSEVPRSRLTGDKVRGLILHPKFLDPSANDKRTQGILVEFRDELCIDLNIGMTYCIAVTYEANHYLAWGIIPVLRESLTNISVTVLPDSIGNLIKLLKEETSGSPWALVSGMAAHLAANIFPLSAFLHLKTALLLSLGSIFSRCPVPVLAIGDCENLMTEILQCSPRAILSPNSPSSLLLANNGVCFLQENINLSCITTAIESDLVTLKTDKLSKNNKYCTYPLQSAVWFSWQCSKNSGQDVHRLKTLIEIFGIPFLEEIELNDEDISNHILSKAMNNSQNINAAISNYDFRKFIDIVSRLHVNMSPMASALIRNYFVASRRERPECLPLKSIKVLTGLSEAHARLSLRDTVTYEDAVAAIFLYEESITVIFGSSVFAQQPKRTIDTNETIDIARQMDNILGRFSLWLSSYTKCQQNTDIESDLIESESE